MTDTTLAGRRIAITGATGGIGRAVTAAVTRAGARVAVCGRSAERLTELAAAHPLALADTTEITDETQVADFLTEAAETLGGLDALITLTGRSVPGPVEDLSLQDFQAMIGSAVVGTFLACKHALPHLGRGGLIINLGSMAGVRPNATAPIYCSAKAAVAMFGDALGLQLADRGIRISTVNPGGVDTDFWGDRPVDRSAMLTPEDVAEVILFLLRLPAHVAVRDLRVEGVAR